MGPCMSGKRLTNGGSTNDLEVILEKGQRFSNSPLQTTHEIVARRGVLYVF